MIVYLGAYLLFSFMHIVPVRHLVHWMKYTILFYDKCVGFVGSDAFVMRSIG